VDGKSAKGNCLTKREKLAVIIRAISGVFDWKDIRGIISAISGAFVGPG
jgi:hypothetical protein